jgi:hypothetical protein
MRNEQSSLFDYLSSEPHSENKRIEETDNSRLVSDYLCGLQETLNRSLCFNLFKVEFNQFGLQKNERCDSFSNLTDLGGNKINEEVDYHRESQ